MNSNLQNDMACLVDSLEFFKDDIPQRTQALEHLADMCLQDKGSILFNKTNGLATVFKIAFNKNTPQVVVQKALLTLGNACLKSDENKGILWSEQVLQFLHDILLSKDQSVKIIASTTYFLACLCSNNDITTQKETKKILKLKNGLTKLI
ncbi:uncharacterized protein LOC130662735 [Hydractinia symbiolongicarpus]|uniref:uncharacterized protein LOC130662735 n=1 Tax=Hydractinia symbiolongicarpus TaxID=13093 RepID=UPI00255103FF|nr:uncharacterized protein LOC130662735 [Hydractinia symbiolongicarpus]